MLSLNLKVNLFSSEKQYYFILLRIIPDGLDTMIIFAVGVQESVECTELDDEIGILKASWLVEKFVTNI